MIRTKVRLGRRFFHISPLLSSKFHYISGFQQLSSKIDSEILQKNDASISDILDSIRACRDLQNSIHNYDSFWEDPTNKQINAKILEILSSDKITFNEHLLKKVLLLQLPTTTNISILNSYYERNPKSYIAKEVGLIPLRQSLFNGDLQNSLKLVDLTCAHKNYIAFRTKELHLGAAKLFTTTIGLGVLSNLGIKYGLEIGYIPETWANMSGVYAMIGTYILNSSFFAAVVKFGRVVVAGGGDYLTWQKGTFYTHWWKHSDEMLMCSKIVETDIALNGNGSASEGLIEELCRTDETLTNGRTLKPGFTREGKKVRLLAPKDNLNEIMLQAYWMSGGDGFEWVEPDQDPAEIMWKQHLSQFEKPLINEGNDKKSLKWADELIET